MEVAESLRNFSCANTLQVCERNIMYQNAILYRDQKEGRGGGGGASSRPGSSRPGGMQGPSPKRNPNVKTFQEDSEMMGDPDEDEFEEEEPYHLEYEKHY